MDLEKPTVWGSFKQRTKPLFQNLSIRRTKKSSTKLVQSRKRYPLDRRLSSSVPDMLNVETVIEEESRYSCSKAMSTYFPNDFDATEAFLPCGAPSNQDREGCRWSQQETVRLEFGVNNTDKLDLPVPSLDMRRNSSGDYFESLQRHSFSSDLTEDPLEVTFIGSARPNAGLVSMGSLGAGWSGLKRVA